MSGGGTIRPNAVINLVGFSLAFNILIMATGFAIMASVSFLRGGSLAGVFGPAAGLLVLSYPRLKLWGLRLLSI